MHNFRKSWRSHKIQVMFHSRSSVELSATGKILSYFIKNLTLDSHELQGILEKLGQDDIGYPFFYGEHMLVESYFRVS